ncbi:MAG TPA: prenyltransferase/squalene oxidase repeat-containing protein [Gemmata sp.]|nr:prenyltransferase/squalene oxidase repeat-containing protein [Gemmata sp.]
MNDGHRGLLPKEGLNAYNRCIRSPLLNKLVDLMDPIQPTLERLHAAYLTARDALLAERVPAGHWVGELSTSALSTATAVMALHLTNPFEHRERIDAGMLWLANHQNPDGGWGDTIKSFSNISTTMLCRAALKMTGAEKEYPTVIEKVEDYLTSQAGKLPERRAEAIRRRYGSDRTFSVPILMSCAIAKLVQWKEVPRLPFELACLPQSWYRFAKLPVVSYALPALIAIGQCVHHHRPTWNPFTGPLRWLSRGLSLKVLQRIQPTSGGYLEATPLTSFVVMALSSIRRRRRPAEQQVIEEGVRFIVNSVRPDGSWPIDTNLATWVTTLSVNAFQSAWDLEAIDSKQIRAWLLNQQYKTRHPYTGADPGGWAWTDLPGGVPDCDDTPGAMLAIRNMQGEEDSKLGYEISRSSWWPEDGVDWLLRLQNRDGGFPTFCRGWGSLPFDRSGADLTAHALRVIGRGFTWGGSEPNCKKPTSRALAYLSKQQRPDGSWLPLWFGNQHAPDDINPVYGTSRVLAAYRDLKLLGTSECQRGVNYLLSVQNVDGGWGGAKDCPSSVEETALAVEVLLNLAPEEAVKKGLLWLVEAVESGRFREPSPIGFYFAKLWYYEKLYPLIFSVAALGRALRV